MNTMYPENLQPLTLEDLKLANKIYKMLDKITRGQPKITPMYYEPLRIQLALPPAGLTTSSGKDGDKPQNKK